MDYNPKYPQKHLSIRVPWHDNGWNGTICQNPKGNDACLRLQSCSSAREDDIEQRLAGKELFVINKEEYFPPCVAERGAFMAPFNVSKEKKHPYAFNKYYKHLQPTDFEYPAFSAPAVPFNWMNAKNAESVASDYALDFDPKREPSVRYGDDSALEFTKKWIQDGQNQKSLLKGFFEHISPKNSLCFFYAKEVPFVEDSARIVIGVGIVESIGNTIPYKSVEHANFNPLLWEHTVFHSIRPNGKNGFLLPYHEAILYQEQDSNFDPADIAVLVPYENTLPEFSFASEHVAHDTAITVLRECVKKLQFAQSLGIGSDWTSKINWCHDRITELDVLRGDYPGLGSALIAFGIRRGHFMAQEILHKIGPHACPWTFLIQAFKNPSEFFSHEIAMQISSDLREVWDQISRENPARLQLLQLISRFNLNVDQAKRTFIKSERIRYFEDVDDKQILDNPYLIYEISRRSEMPVGFLMIDNGLMRSLDKPLLPYRTHTFHALSSIRIRALTIFQLELASSEGHSLLPESELIRRITDMSLDPQCNLSEDHFAVAIKVFSPSIVSQEMAPNEVGSHEPAFQLSRLSEAGNLISLTIKKRLNGKRHQLNLDWGKILDEQIEFKDDADDTRAREEKVIGLKEICNARISILTGYAGTGKTTLIAALSSIPEIAEGNVLLLAPTGKARVRMESLARDFGVTAKTIAQLLYKSKRFNGRTQSYHLNENPTESGYKTVIIDESSMLTEEMLASTLQHLQKIERLVLVGDYRQLPPIGAGRPFVDIIDFIKPANIDQEFPRVGSGFVELTIGGRQRGQDRLDLDFANLFGGSSNTKSSDKIFTDVIRGKGARVKIIPWDAETDIEPLILKTLEDEFQITDSSSFNSAFGANENGFFDFGTSIKQIENWQILSPVRSKTFGTTMINRSIHEHFKHKVIEWAENWTLLKTPKPFGPQQIVYGDKVICLQNQSRDKVYPDGGIEYIANGEIGLVIGRFKRKTDTFKGKPWYLEVEFSTQQGYKYNFYSDDFNEERDPSLELAYALTVHKSQGSQFNSCIIVIPDPCPILSRELLYTALTRHKERIIILYQGNPQRLFNYTYDHHSSTLKRLTNLFYKPSLIKQDNQFFEQNLIHCARDGKMLRSKSELLIYEALKDYRLNPEYEKPLTLGGETRFPDFYIEDDETGEKYFWEHLGLLNNPSYRESWEEKKLWYEKHGIREGGGEAGTLITTEDDVHGGISIKNIREVISNSFSLISPPSEPSWVIKILTAHRELRQDLDIIKGKVSEISLNLNEIKSTNAETEEKINKIYDKIDSESQLKNLEFYLNEVKSIYPLSNKLETSSREFIASALQLYSSISSGKGIDYSPYIIQYSRALENELSTKIFRSFPNMLFMSLGKDKEGFLEAEFANTKSQVFARMLYKDREDYTLGMMVKVLEFIHNPSGNTLSSSPLFQEFRKHLLSKCKPTYLSKPILDVLIRITNEYRNKAAHVEVLTKNDADTFGPLVQKSLIEFLDAVDI